MTAMKPALLAAALLAACEATPDEAPPPTCGEVALRYAPFESDELELFPDPLHTYDDPTSPTGQRLLVDPTRAPWAVGTIPLTQGLIDALPTVSGFSRQGALLLRFTGDIGELPDGNTPEGRRALRLLDLSTGAPVDVPWSATKSEAGTQVLLQPLRPLAPGAPHAVVMTREFVASDGACVASSPTMRALLDGTEDDPRLVRLVPRYQALLETLGLRPDDVTLAVPFTTADERGPLTGAAEDLRADTFQWSTPPVCTPDWWGMRCEGTFIAHDYRRDGGLVQDHPWADWELKATIGLPASPGPHPLVIYGHGINSGRGEAITLAEHVAQHGIAVASVDAMRHGAHPTKDPEQVDALAFLGLDLVRGTLDGVQMRADFDQTTLDRLQLLELLTHDLDVDHDGHDDVDPTRVGYVGVSLGGLLGPAFLAESRAQIAALPVGGGYLLKFATDMNIVGSFRALFAGLLGGEEEFDRFLVLGQTAVDGSDPAVWASHVLHNRVNDFAVPNVLLPVAIADQVVPPAAGQALARGFGLMPHISPVSVAVPLVGPVQEAPVTENLDARATVGFFQLSTVTHGGVVETAVHENTPLSDECSAQWTEFLRSWAVDGAPVIIDPYAQ